MGQIRTFDAHRSISHSEGVVEQHRENVAIDVYLLRGLSDQADLLFRIHAMELRDTQAFLLDLQSSQFGKHLAGIRVMHGLTKKPNYVPGFSDQLRTDLKVPSETGEKPYAIVIPIKSQLSGGSWIRRNGRR